MVQRHLSTLGANALKSQHGQYHVVSCSLREMKIEKIVQRHDIELLSNDIVYLMGLKMRAEHRATPK